MHRNLLPLTLFPMLACFPNTREDKDSRPPADADADTDSDTDADTDSETDTADVDRDGYSEADGDCDDTDDTVHPEAMEVCENGKDDDCDGGVNDVDAIGCVLFYVDGDADGYGAGEGECVCAAVDAFTTSAGGDCDDINAAVHPGATETYNGIDDDCSGVTDGLEACPTADVTVAYGGYWGDIEGVLVPGVITPATMDCWQSSLNIRVTTGCLTNVIASGSGATFCGGPAFLDPDVPYVDPSTPSSHGGSGFCIWAPAYSGEFEWGQIMIDGLITATLDSDQGSFSLAFTSCYTSGPP
jgi:hypothetical protein